MWDVLQARCSAQGGCAQPWSYLLLTTAASRLPPHCPFPALPQELCLLTKHLQAAQRNSLLLRLGCCPAPPPCCCCCCCCHDPLPVCPALRPTLRPPLQVITTAMSVGASAVRQRATGEGRRRRRLVVVLGPGAEVVRRVALPLVCGLPPM